MRSILYTLFAAVGACAIASPSFAQEAQPGAYGIVRAGVAIDSDFRFPDRDRRAPSNYPENVDFKPGFIGEIGGGYDLGAFRLEGTVGYSHVKLDRKRAGNGFADDGRARAFSVGVSGYFDIPASEAVVPFVGGGIGASRVDARLARIGGAPDSLSGFRDKDWGFHWHFDAGVGIKASERTTIELGARYTRTSALRLEGMGGATATDYRPRLSNTSIMLGIRQGF